LLHVEVNAFSMPVGDLISVALNKLHALEAPLADPLGWVAQFLRHFVRQRSHFCVVSTALPDVCSGMLSLLAAAFTLLASGCSSSQSALRLCR